MPKVISIIKWDYPELKKRLRKIKENKIVLAFYEGDAEIHAPNGVFYQHETERIISILKRLGFSVERITKEKKEDDEFEIIFLEAIRKEKR